MKKDILLFSGRQYHEHRKYWKQKLAAETSFVLQRHNPGGQPPNAAQEYEFGLGEEAGAVLKKYAGDRNLESFILLLTGFYILFSRYEDTETITLHSPLLRNGAYDRVQEPLVPLIQRVAPAMEVKELLKEVNENVLQSYKYQNYPLDLLSDDQAPADQAPLSNVLIWFDGLHEPCDAETARTHDLVIRIARTGTAGLQVHLTFHSPCYADWFLPNLVRHLGNIIRGYDNLQTPVGDLELMPVAERQQLASFNETDTPYPAAQTVVDVFGAVAARAAHCTAVVYAGRKLTYTDLDQRSNRLAAYLRRECQVGPGSYVGVMVEKSDYAIVGLLAVLKAGAAYVPIDPQLPLERIYSMIDDTGLRTILTVSDHLFRLDRFTGALFALDIQQESLPDAAQPFPAAPRPSDAAYVIYTSGSTGRPKGVQIDHRGLLNVALDHVAEFGMTEADRYLQFMSLSFDGSLLDIFTALLSGAALVLPTRDIINSTERFIQYVAEQQVTVTTLTPSYLGTLDKHRLDSVRIIVSAGEAARAEDARYYASFKTFYNGYGPSEAAVNTTLHKVVAGAASHVVPVGKPRANKKVFILNRQRQRVPIGIVGEIAISGMGLAPGYLNDETLSGEKFIDHPFVAGEKLYLTGDLGRWGADGNIEFCGRKDEQIKLNGFRIDTHEIEKSLLDHSLVRNAVVVHQQEGAVNRLVAFYQKDAKTEIVPSLGEYGVYDPFIYESMATDAMRVAGYRNALREVVKNRVVLDPGTGRDMVLARHCLEAGARKVYAIEIDDDAYRTARENLEKWGLTDKIVLLHGDIRDLELPAEIEYCVSALAGNIASSDGCIPIMRSLKSRLAGEVNFVPDQYCTRIAAVSLPESGRMTGLSEVSAHYVSEVFRKTGYPFDLRLCLKNFSRQSIISGEATCENIRYRDDLSPREETYLGLPILQDSVVHGFALWINAYADGQKMIDSLEKTHHLPVYFPVFGAGVAVRAGDAIEMVFRRELSDNGLNPDYFLEGVLRRAGHAELNFRFESGNHRPQFRTCALYQELFAEGGAPNVRREPGEKDFKDFLSTQLPYYMIPSRVVPVPEVPLTANDKVDKKMLLQLLTPEAEKATASTYRNETEKLVIDTWESVLGRKPIGVDDDFFMLGGDSIKAILIAARMYKLGYKIEVKDIFEHPVVADLAGAIKPLERIADQSAVTGPVPLTPVQREMFGNNPPEPHHYNQSVMLYARQGFDAGAVEGAFARIEEHHDALRMTCRLHAGERVQTNNGLTHSPRLAVYDLRGDKDATTTLSREAARLQGSFSLEAGPLLKIALFRLNDGDRLLIVVHHLVMDGVSWRILFEDFSRLYGQYTRGEALTMPPKTDSFKLWAEKLLVYANAPALLAEKSYWREVVAAKTPPIPRDFTDDSSFRGDSVTVSAGLSAEETELLLTRVHKACGTEMNDILLAALSLGVFYCFGLEAALVSVEGHGREPIGEEINVSRTVGWFTSCYPVRLTASGYDLQGHILATREALRKVPNKGMGYGVLKYLTPAESRADLRFDAHPQINFNYLGQFDTDVKSDSFEIAQEYAGETQSYYTPRTHDFVMNGMVATRCLTLSLNYNKRHFRQETVDRFLAAYTQALREIIAHCTRQHEAAIQPAGFTYDKLTGYDIDSLFA